MQCNANYQRDPKGYKEEFLSQHNHYLSLLRLNSAATATSSASASAIAPQSNNAKDKSDELFADLITFICQVAQCYPDETKELPAQLQGLLLGRNGYTMVRGDLRKTAVKNLVMLRNKEVIDSIEYVYLVSLQHIGGMRRRTSRVLPDRRVGSCGQAHLAALGDDASPLTYRLLQTLLPLLPHVPSVLRTFIRHTILTDLKTSNAKTKNHRLNRVVQSLLFGMVESGMQSAVVGDKGKGRKNASKEKGGEAMWAVMMVRELWKKGVWKDAKTVSIVSLAAFHPNTKVQAAAMHFFLGSEDDDGEEEDEEEEVREARRDVKKMEHRLEVGKAGRKKEKALKLAKREANKVCIALRVLAHWCVGNSRNARLTLYRNTRKRMMGSAGHPTFPLSSYCTIPRRLAKSCTTICTSTTSCTRSITRS